MSARTRAFAAALTLCLACGTALAQGPTPTALPVTTVPGKPGVPGLPLGGKPAAPSSSASPAPSGSAGALPPGHPPTGDLPPGHPPTGDLPPGHPPTGDMPPGHPPTGDMPPGHPPTSGMPPGHPPTGDEDDDEDTGDDPHAGANPHGAQGNPHGAGGPNNARNGLFDAPPDTSEDDQSLPLGTIVLTLKDAAEKPVPGAEVTLGILHNTVAAGESRDRRTGVTDAEGMFVWKDLPHGSGTSYRASIMNGPAQFGTEPFSLGDRTGKRVVLHAYDVTEDPKGLVVLAKGFASVSLGEDSLVIVQQYDIFNGSPMAWVPRNVELPLPEGYKAFNRPDSMDGVGVDEVNGRGVLRGTITPGIHNVVFRFQVPLDGDERQKVRIEAPVRLVRAQVIAEAGKTTGLTVRGEPRGDEGRPKRESLDFPAARKTRNREGKRVLVSDWAMSREDGTLKAMEITLTGLPTAGSGRWMAAALAFAAFVAGLAYAQQRAGQKGRDAETRNDLLDAREALLREMVDLERAFRAGEIGPKTHERLRNALLDAIERLMSKIAEATPKKPPPSRVADVDESEA